MIAMNEPPLMSEVRKIAPRAMATNVKTINRRM